MATSKCPASGCGGTSFEVKKADLGSSAKVPFVFVQCSTCGAVVGALEGAGTTILLHKIMQKLGISP